MENSKLTKINQIADKARDSIGKFCYEECKSLCCRKGVLNLNESNVDIVTNGKRKELENKKLLTKTKDGTYSMFLDGNNNSCPSLKDNKCTIHTNPLRPSVCKHFPLFLDGNVIKLSPQCLAVKEGLFYPYIAQLLKEGCTLYKKKEKE